MPLLSRGRHGRPIRVVATTGVVALLALAGACGSSTPASGPSSTSSSTTSSATSSATSSSATSSSSSDTPAPSSSATSTGSDSSGAASSPISAPSASALSGSATGSASAANGPLIPVKLQLQWFTQAQFAGYIAARDTGLYKAAGLDVTILEGGSDIVPQNVLAQGQADYAIAWVPKALQSREQGAKITDVGQVFQRSGTLQVSLKKTNINSVADLKGKKVGDWGYGNEYELFAAMGKAGINPGSDIQLVQQQFDMQGLLSGDIDAAQGMIYNEYAQVLEAQNPDTGKLYTADELNRLNWNDTGTAMLQDAIWANTDKLKNDTTYQNTTVKFLAASYAGWIYCAQKPTECRDLVVKAGSKLGASHQLWQMNEVDKLIWPSPDGIGMVNDAAWKQTVTVASATKNADGKTVLTKTPDNDAYTNEFTKEALTLLKNNGLDVTGSTFKPISVTLNAGGS